jgi:hypothetical protein
MIPVEVVEEIEILMSCISYDKGYLLSQLYSNQATRLITLYNSHPEFNGGKKEGLNCRPCRKKVLYFFSGFIVGHKLAAK